MVSFFIFKRGVGEVTFEYVRERYAKRLKHLICVVGVDTNCADVEELMVVMRALNKMCVREVKEDEDGVIAGKSVSYQCCPNCGHRLNDKHHWKHCGHCGQKLGW